MSRKQRRASGRSQDEAAHPQDGTGPRAGTYPIDTGTAELEPDRFHPGAWLLRINGVQSSHVVIGEPRELAFEYMRWMVAGLRAHLEGRALAAAGHDDVPAEDRASDRASADAASRPRATAVPVSSGPSSSKPPAPSALRVTHLGGGACSLARYLAAVYPGSRHTVVELDAVLAARVREWFDIPRAPIVRIRVGEARAVTETFGEASRDVILRDVFAGALTPEPLTTVEFFRHAHRALAPGGLYAANCGDGRDLAGARAEVAGLLEAFRHVAVIADPPMLKGRRYGNVILLASDSPLPAEGSDAAARLARELLAGAVPAQYKDEAWARRFAAGAVPRRDPQE